MSPDPLLDRLAAANPVPNDKRLSKTGQPKMGSKWILKLDSADEPVTVVAKMFGRKGSAELIGIIFEYEDGERSQPCRWPDVRRIMR